MSSFYGDVKHGDTVTPGWMQDVEDLHGSGKPAQLGTYIIFYDSSNSEFKARDGSTGVIDYHNDDAVTLIQDAVDALPSAGGGLYLQPKVYLFNRPLEVPVNKLVALIGEVNPLSNRDSGVCLRANTSMDYVINAEATAGSGDNIQLVLENLNVEPWNQSNTGGIYHASDNNNVPSPMIRNVRIHYPTTHGLHIVGLSWRGIIENLLVDGYSATNTCQDLLRLEEGSYATVPKVVRFVNTDLRYGGLLNHGVYLRAAYCNFVNTEIDTGYFANNCLKILAGYNKFVNLRIQDVHDGVGGAESTIIFSGSDSFQNSLLNVSFAAGVGAAGVLVKFTDSAERNFVQVAPTVATEKIVADATSGSDNQIEFLPSKLFTTLDASGVVAGKVKFMGGYKLANSGTSTGTGAEQTIAHGLCITPNRVFFTNEDDGANPYQSSAADATNIYVTAVSTKKYQWKAWYE